MVEILTNKNHRKGVEKSLLTLRFSVEKFKFGQNEKFRNFS